MKRGEMSHKWVAPATSGWHLRAHNRQSHTHTRCLVKPLSATKPTKPLIDCAMCGGCAVRPYLHLVCIYSVFTCVYSPCSTNTCISEAIGGRCGHRQYRLYVVTHNPESDHVVVSGIMTSEFLEPRMSRPERSKLAESLGP